MLSAVVVSETRYLVGGKTCASLDWTAEGACPHAVSGHSLLYFTKVSPCGTK